MDKINIDIMMNPIGTLVHKCENENRKYLEEIDIKKKKILQIIKCMYFNHDDLKVVDYCNSELITVLTDVRQNKQKIKNNDHKCFSEAIDEMIDSESIKQIHYEYIDR